MDRKISPSSAACRTSTHPTTPLGALTRRSLARHQLPQLYSSPDLYILSTLTLRPQPLLRILLLIHLILPRQRELSNRKDSKNGGESDTGAVEKEDGAETFGVALSRVGGVSVEARRGGWWCKLTSDGDRPSFGAQGCRVVDRDGVV